MKLAIFFILRLGLSFLTSKAELVSSSTSSQSKVTEFSSANHQVDELFESHGPIDSIVNELRLDEDVASTIRSWKQTRRQLEAINKEAIRQFRPPAERFLAKANLSIECNEALQTTIDALERSEGWAVQMLNSWGRLPLSGLYEGHQGSQGAYKQCLAVPANNHVNHTHYCSIYYQPVIFHTLDRRLLTKPPEYKYSADNETVAIKTPTAHNGCFEPIIDKMTTKLNYNLELGTCFPSQCSPSDVQKLAKLIGRHAALITVSVKCKSVNNENYEHEPNASDNLMISTGEDLDGRVNTWKPHVTQNQWFALGIIGFITVIIALATLVDLCAIIKSELIYDIQEFKTAELEPKAGSSKEMSATKPPGTNDSCITFVDTLRGYSIIKNSKQYFHVARNPSSGDISCIHGLRTLVMCTIICHHASDEYVIIRLMFFASRDQLVLASLHDLFTNRNLVGVFFAISGLLCSFTAFKRNPADGLPRRFTAIRYLVNRYLRLTPQVLLSILLIIIVPLVSSYGSPHWCSTVGRDAEVCCKNWWINMLHLQSYSEESEICSIVSWYISADMIFHLFGAMIISLSLNRSRKLGLAFGICIALMLSIGSATQHYTSSMDIFMMPMKPGEPRKIIYYQAQTHALHFFLGLLFGYLMAEHGSHLAAFFQLKSAPSGWILVACITFLQPYYAFMWHLGEHRSQLTSTCLFMLSSIVCDIRTLWIVLACHYGCGGWINQVLSCKLFKIMSKSSYLTYLIQFPVIYVAADLRDTMSADSNPLLSAIIMIGDVFLVNLLGSFLHVVYEMAWFRAQKQFIK